MITLQTIKRKMKPGMQFTYSELCKFLRDDIKSGNSRMAQLKEWERYIDFDLKDRVYTITGIHKHIYPKQNALKPDTINVIDRDGTKFQKGKYSHKMGYLLQEYLKDKTDHTAVFTKRQILTGMGLTASGIFSPATTTLLKNRSSLSSALIRSMRYLLFKSANDVLKNFKTSSWGKCFSFEPFYCGRRKWEPNVYDLKKAHPEVIKFLQDDYIFSKKMIYVTDENGNLDYYIPESACGFDGIIYSKRFQKYMIEKEIFKYFFIAYRIKQLEPLPYMDIDLNLSVMEINKDFNEWAKRIIRKDLFVPSDHEIDCFIKFNAIDERRKSVLYWSDVSKTLDFIEDFDEIQI